MKIIKYLCMLFLLIGLVACTSEPDISYEILVNNDISTDYQVGDVVDYKNFFTITDSLGHQITVEDGMLDVTNVNMQEAGDYVIKITYENLHNQVTIRVTLPEEVITYTISKNETILTTIELHDTSIDFTAFFKITDSNNNTIEVLESMVDASMINIAVPGTYILKLEYQGQSLSLEISVVDVTPPITYAVNIDNDLPTQFSLGTDDIDFKDYFSIVDSLGEVFEVTDDMIDITAVDLNTIGGFTVTLSFKDITKLITFEVIPPEFMHASDLFISEYSEGSSYNKYIEIFNGTGQCVDLSHYALKLFNHAAIPAQYVFDLSGILNDGELLVVYNSGANSTIKALGDVSNSVISFNGNDPIALYKNDVLIDVVGDLTTPVSEGYDAGGVVKATKDHTIIRKSDVFGPSATWTPNQWDVLGFEVFTDLKQHKMDYYHAPEPVLGVPDLFISEYFEGNGIYNNSKYIEIYNGLGYDVDLSDYAINLYSGGNTEAAYIQPLSGILKDSQVYIVYSIYASEDIKLVGNLASEVAYFNGRHAIALTKHNEIIDLFGVIGDYPGEDGWLLDGISGTANNTLIRNYSVTTPTATWDKDEWYICYENYLYDIGQHNVTYEDQVIEDFDILFNLITNLELNDKGTAISSYTVTIKGTVYMDVHNETTLVYITDGKSFIKLHGTKIHNFTSPHSVYEVTGYYKSHLYIPTFEVIAPNDNITIIRDESPITDISIKEVTLTEILNLKSENFVYNLNQGYLQSMLKVKGYLQLDTHNSTRWDYALTIGETYTKNNTQYIHNGLYFKNDVEALEDFLVDYEVHPDYESVEVDIIGVIYDWNPNRKNWRLYVSDTLTLDNLESNPT